VEEVTHLEGVINQRLDTMERQVASDRTATEEQLSIWRENVEQQLTQLSSTVAEVNTQEEPASQAELTALEAQWTQRTVWEDNGGGLRPNKWRIYWCCR